MPILPRAITPLGSIATRASRRDIGQSLSNVVFHGTVLRIREVPSDAATRYTYDVRVQIGSTEATRVTIAGAPGQREPARRPRAFNPRVSAGRPGVVLSGQPLRMDRHRPGTAE